MTILGKKHSEESKQKIREANFGKKLSEETKQKIREAKLGKQCSEETKQKIREANLGKNNPNFGKFGKNNPNFGKKLSEETKQKMSEAKLGENHPNFGKHLSEESKQKMRKAKLGENNSNWRGGISFDPYCEKFNKIKKEEVREQYNRKCYICEKLETDQIKEQKLNGKRGFRLSIHHIDNDKEQGCNGKKWKLVPLCIHCHNSGKLNYFGDIK